ncbi:MAG: HEAT repeat domain-containing protein, partial [Chloroflexota bacterium]
DRKDAMPSFKETLEAMAANRRLTPPQTKQLSGLRRDQLQQFSTAWSGLPDRARMTLLATLRQNAEEDSLVDFDAIYEMAIEDPNADVRRLAIGASVDDTSAELLKRLLDICLHDPDETVRAAAADRLGGFALEAELGDRSEEDARDIQRVLLDRAQSETETASVRAAALASVGYLSTEEVRSEIRRAITRSGLRLAAIQAMGRNIDPIWTESLVQQMGSEDPAVRREAALAAADYEDTVETVADLVDDPDGSVRLAAVASLGQIGGPVAREALVYCYESADPAIQEAAAEALAAIEAAEHPLGSLADDED